MQRIDKIISSQTSYSRNDVKKLIRKGLVTVNDSIIKKCDTIVDEETSIIKINDKVIDYKKYIYLILNKPKGYISSTRDGNDPIVLELIDSKYLNRNLFPVGRLDKDTTGLMIISDDGEFSHNLLSPKKHVSKKYLVEVDKDLEEYMIDDFKNGIKLNDGICKSSLLEIIDNRNCYVTLYEGRYHQIKRMFGNYGMKVINLKRVKFGGLDLPLDLEEGDFRELTYKEMELIYEKSIK